MDDNIFNNPLKNLTKQKLLKMRNYMNFETYIEHNFYYFYHFNERNIKNTKITTEDYNFYLCATNTTPKFSYYDITSFDIFEAIKKWINVLVLKTDENNNKKNSLFNKLLNNYIFIYGDFNFLNKIKNEVLLIYDKIVIPIYDTDQLYFNYNNNIISIENINNDKIYELNWKPYNSSLQYNTIIEKLMFFNFDLLSILYPTTWSFLDDSYLYTLIKNDIDNNNYITNNNYNRKVIIKNYLYQSWLIFINLKKNNQIMSNKININNIDNKYNYGQNFWSFNRVKILNLFIEYIPYGIPYKNIEINYQYNYDDFNYFEPNISQNQSYILILFILFILFIVIFIIYFMIYNINNNSIYNNPFYTLDFK